MVDESHERGRHRRPRRARRRRAGPVPGVRWRRERAPSRGPGFAPPPYPYDRLGGRRPRSAAAHPGGLVDLLDRAPRATRRPPAVVEALATSGTERGYPASIGSAALPRAAAAGWMRRRFAVSRRPDAGGRVRRHQGVRGHARRGSSGCARPGATPCSYPAVAYPTYAMGARLAGCRAVAVPAACRRRPRPRRPSPPTTPSAPCACGSTPRPTRPGRSSDLGAAAAWGRAHGVPGVLRRVLRRVHLGRPADAPSLQHGTDGRGGRALAVEALEPGRGARRVLRRRRRAGRVPGRGAPARRAHGARARCRPPPWWPSTTTTTSRRSAALPRPPGPAGRDPARRRARRSRCPPAASTCGCRCRPGPRRRRAEGRAGAWVLTDGTGRGGRDARQPGRPLRLAGRRGFVRIAVVQPDDRIELVATRLAARCTPTWEPAPGRAEARPAQRGPTGRPGNLGPWPTCSPRSKSCGPGRAS